MKSWHCNECSREFKTEDHVEIHFHNCDPQSLRALRARRWIPPDLEGTTLEETWAQVFATAYGGYRPPTPEEAREETGEFGRRKDGSGRSSSSEQDA